MPTNKTFPATTAGESLRKKGYSLRTAAPLLGVHFGHLHQVIQGRRESRRLIAAIEKLPHFSAKTSQKPPFRQATAKASRH